MSATDTGKDYVVPRGTRVVVNLAAAPIYTWTRPASSDNSVLRLVSGSSGAAAGAVFVASADGRAGLSATAGPTCYPGCLAPVRRWQVSVTVTG